MSPADFLAKAETAVRSARVLVEAADPDGACNRAYYAMFDAARAALLMSSAPVHSEVARTHSGRIAAFGLHMVKTGLLDAELGRALNRAQQVRMIADYTGDPVDLETTRGVVEQAADFVSRIQQFATQLPARSA